MVDDIAMFYVFIINGIECLICAETYDNNMLARMAWDKLRDK